ncbi:MAG: alanine--glyoxylate aminotransferase family protein [Mailhella sp.]|nr:alanine--glyoxylate aminotransferase family protein [Mailhella sp.]
MSTFHPYAPMPFYPGPVSIHPAVASVLSKDYAPPRMGTEYLDLYRSVRGRLQTILGTKEDVVIGTGEGMLVLWGALKSLLKPGDTVLSVGTGVFGDGFGDMAEILGCKAVRISEPYDSTITESTLEKVKDAIHQHRPVLMTAVHCETPSGTLNPLEELGRIKQETGVPFFVVDAVASAGGAPVHADAWHADCVLGGSQKCLSCPPDMSFMSVSEAAWARIREVGYAGYDAIKPFDGAVDDIMRHPYTPNWWGVAALDAALRALEEEGLENVFQRHENVARQCREGLASIGIQLWTRAEAVNSPTVTAARIPDGWTWPAWREALAAEGLIVGGSLGPMNGKVFRLGHMGTQADAARMASALSVLAKAVGKKTA